MNPHLVGVEVIQEYVLKLAFENKEVRLFDASPFSGQRHIQGIKRY